MARHLFREVDGYYLHVAFSEQTIRSALGYKPVPEDVFIVSYPKCGTTWMQHLVYNIFNGRAPPTNMMDVWREMPFLELQGAESLKEMPRPGAVRLLRFFLLSHEEYFGIPVSGRHVRRVLRAVPRRKGGLRGLL
ncbi:unnamed protein product [Ixodes persulcatus]